MHTVSVRASARRTALAAAIAATALVGIPSSSAAPTPEEARPEVAAASLSGPEAHPRRVIRQVEHRDAVLAKRHAELVAERRAERAERRAERAERRAAQAALSQGDQVIDLASNEAGDPYVWGAAGPSSFDCSGLTQYVFAQVGVSLPHSSSAQAGMATPVSDPQVGDLVFFSGSGGVYHVAIYAGDGQIWHAPRPGEVVKLEPMWTTSGVSYGRVL